MTDRLVIRQAGTDGRVCWLATAGEAVTVKPDWTGRALQMFDEHIEAASLSVVRADDGANGVVQHATHAALPVCFINSRVSELIGFAGERASRHDLEAAMSTASLKGMPHYWLRDLDAPGPAIEIPAGRRATPVVVGGAPGPRPAAPVSVGLDASWLLGGESGAQVFTLALARELAARPEIERLVMLSDSGGVPAALHGVARISGMTWQAALAPGARRLDVLHRPYQPNADTPMDLYRQVANAVVITVLDFIAYDNVAYHETPDHWAQYREAFDERVGAADHVVAISRTVAARLQRQFAHRLATPVSAVLGGTEHLSAQPGAASQCPAGVSTPFAVVLGNDFAHKNRDFAVRVFADMCARGYAGSLVLAGYHLDLGSSFGHELGGAGAVRERIVRLGPVSQPEKRYLLERADVVLYPTSSEGFGLVPFEAAALGTPCAFVRFGPLKETMPDVLAADEWSVSRFTDLVFELLGNSSRQVEQIRTAGATLTWSRAAAEMAAIYQRTAAEETPWASRRIVAAAPPAERFGRLLRQQGRRVTRKLRRIVTGA